MDFRIFKIYPIKNSFDISIKEFIKYISKEYKSSKITYKSKTKLNGALIGSSLDKMEKPKYLYVRVNFMINCNWSNSGGLEYAQIKLDEKNYLSIRWNTHKSWKCDLDKNIEEFNLKIIRTKKLDKLEF